MLRSPLREPNPSDRSLYLGYSALEITLAVSGVSLLVGFLYLMQEMLTPPIIAGAGIILLWPIRRQRAVQALMLTGGFLLVVWLLHKLSFILIPFASLYLLAYLFDPVVSHLHIKYRIRRWFSSLVVTTSFVSVIALFILILAPSLIGQLDALSVRTLAGIQDLQHWLLTSPLIDELVLAGFDKEDLIAQFTQTIQNFLHSWADVLPNTAGRLLKSVSSIFGVLTVLILLPVILFYSLKDFGIIKEGIRSLLPTIGGTYNYLTNTGQIVGQYLRGQLTISAITALMVSVALMLADIPFALLIGVTAGVLNLIPSLGAIITNFVGICIALLFGERGLLDVVIVVAVLLGQSLLEQAILVPKILSQHVGLHPVVILLSLFIFGYFFGFLGLFIAVPLTALLIAGYESIRAGSSLDLSSFMAVEKASNVAEESAIGVSKNIEAERNVTFPPQERPINRGPVELISAETEGE